MAVAADLPPLSTLLSVVESLLVGGVTDGGPLDPHGEAGAVHHGEHRPHALAFLADQISHGAVGVAVGEHAGRRGVDAHLVFDRHAGHVVAIADRSVVVHEELRNDEQRDPLGAGGRSGDAGQHQVDDVLGHVVFAEADVDLGAGDQVGAVALRFGLRGAQTDVGAGLRLGEVHGSGPLAGHELAEIGLLLFLGAPRLECLDGAGGESGTHGQGAVRGRLELEGRREHRLGEARTPVLGFGVEALPTRGHELGVGLLEPRGRGDDPVGEVEALDVARSIQRSEDLVDEPTLLLEHRHDGVVVGVCVVLRGGELVELADVAEGEECVLDGGPVVRHGQRLPTGNNRHHPRPGSGANATEPGVGAPGSVV